MPIVIAASARLNGGQPSGSLMKSVTEPLATRSRMLPSAPPISSPVGSQIQGRVDVQREIDEQHQQRERRSGS